MRAYQDDIISRTEWAIFRAQEPITAPLDWILFKIRYESTEEKEEFTLGEDLQQPENLNGAQLGILKRELDIHLNTLKRLLEPEAIETFLNILLWRHDRIPEQWKIFLLQKPKATLLFCYAILCETNADPYGYPEEVQEVHACLQGLYDLYINSSQETADHQSISSLDRLMGPSTKITNQEIDDTFVLSCRQIIESASDLFLASLTKAERKTSLDDIMALFSSETLDAFEMSREELKEKIPDEEMLLAIFLRQHVVLQLLNARATYRYEPLSRWSFRELIDFYPRRRAQWLVLMNQNFAYRLMQEFKLEDLMGMNNVVLLRFILNHWSKAEYLSIGLGIRLDELRKEQDLKRAVILFNNPRKIKAYLNQGCNLSEALSRLESEHPMHFLYQNGVDNKPNSRSEEKNISFRFCQIM